MKFDNFLANPAPNGLIKGNGSDTVGKFVFDGKFEDPAKKVNLKK